MITTPVAPALNLSNRRADTWPRHRTRAQERRAPRTKCAATGCPFLTRDVFCPLHTRVTDTGHHPPIGVKVTATRRLSRARPSYGGLASPFLAANPPAPPSRRGSCSPEHTPAAPRPPHKCSNPEKRNTE